MNWLTDCRRRNSSNRLTLGSIARPELTWCVETWGFCSTSLGATSLSSAWYFSSKSSNDFSNASSRVNGFPTHIHVFYTFNNTEQLTVGAVGLVVEYRARNRDVAGSTHTRSTASNVKQVANLLCAQANSASYWVVAHLLWHENTNVQLSQIFV